MLDWIRNTALPFWGSAGVDWDRGGFHERLDLAGRPIIDVPKRLMVQGRQLYVYCHAGLLGWYPHADARALADRCVDDMIASFYRPDGKPGFVHSVAPDGGVADATRDLYGHAFALLGLAWYHRLTGDTEVLKVADATLACLDQSLASDHGGYLDAVPRARRDPPAKPAHASVRGADRPSSGDRRCEVPRARRRDVWFVRRPVFPASTRHAHGVSDGGFATRCPTRAAR